MFQDKFYQIFTDFLGKNKISQCTKGQNIKNQWIPFLNINETKLQHCICGHKVKNTTYLFNYVNKTIIFIGTSCCKKYGLLEKHMENDILINILRRQISQFSYNKNENIIFLTKDFWTTFL